MQRTGDIGSFIALSKSRQPVALFSVLYCGFNPETLDDTSTIPSKNRNYTLSTFSYFLFIYFSDIKELDINYFRALEIKTHQYVILMSKLMIFEFMIIQIFKDFYKLKFGCKIDKDK